MCIHRLRGLFVFALALCAQPAWAFLDPPYITPASPVAGEPISVNVRGTECDLINDGVIWPPPVTQQGNAITILFTGIHEEDPEFCYYSPDSRAYPIGAYPAGTYTLRVDWRYSTFNGWVTQTLGTLSFTVSDGSQRLPVEAPALSNAGLAGLLLMLVMVSLHTLHRRVRSH
jgi:hypothetical protein